MSPAQLVSGPPSAGSVLRLQLAGADFVHACQATTRRDGRSALQAYRDMAATIPGWFDGLMALRNRGMRLLGMKHLGQLHDCVEQRRRCIALCTGGELQQWCVGTSCLTGQHQSGIRRQGDRQLCLPRPGRQRCRVGRVLRGGCCFSDPATGTAEPECACRNLVGQCHVELDGRCHGGKLPVG
nr:DUF2867 domain-containing protein [Stenotrophomonas maltophilia]